MRNYIVLFACLISFFGLSAQSLPPSSAPCASDHLNEALFQQDREALNRMKFFDDNLASGMIIPPGADASYTIPVVVHIIHNNGPENISNNQVLDAIQHLNDAFANTGVYNPNTGVDVDIQFCLAVRDPNGMATTGINRVQSPLTNLTVENDDIALKNLSRWDPTQYLNIWVVNEITSTAMGSGVAGYAYFPSSHGQPEDGIVNEARFFGSTTDDSKIHVHEAGHYLGLYHTFQGGCTNNNCLTDGDRVCDTPPDASTNPVSCGSSINTCTTDEDDTSVNNPYRPVAMGGLGEQDDMYINYMDYGLQVCQNAFTDGQKGRMTAAITGVRSSLLSSPGCQTVCASPVVSAFTAGATTVYLGTMVSFTNQSTGATQYDWKINGTNFSNATSPNYTFSNLGFYDVTLVASNTGQGCIDSTTVTIEVICTAQASFTASSQQVTPGTFVSFTNTSVGATSSTWLIDGNVASTSFNFNSQFNTPGGYHIQLIATNGTCSDTSNTLFVNVGTCVNKRDNIWYFGENQGLDFSSGSPVALSNSAMAADEGSATICDDGGNLLFYTNSKIVYDRNHNQMPNGTGLQGHISSTQSCLITPRPGYPDQYYIFTADAIENQNTNGIRYSIVDMTLNSGNGDVTSTKNILMYAPNAEKLTAHYQANQSDIWVMTKTRNSKEYRAYSVTPTGVSTTPVVTTLLGSEESGVLGGMKFSHNGKKIATSCVGSTRGVEIVDFDPLTGVVSNPIFVPILIQGYNLEFSESDLKLYISNWNGGGIYQIDLGAGSPTAIINSVLQISTGLASDLRLGPDNKIYVSKAGFSMTYGVINDPEIAGTGCNYNATQITMAGRVYNGTNNLFAGYDLPREPEIVGPDVICLGGGNTVWSIGGVSPGDSVDWILTGVGNILSETSTDVTVSLPTAGSGSIIMNQTTSCGFLTDTIFFQVVAGLNLDLGSDTVLCPGSPLTLDAGPGFTSYLWQNNSTGQTLQVTGPGTYTVQVTNSGGCTATDSIVVAPFVQATSVQLGPDTDICPNGVFHLDAGPGFVSYLWQDGSTQQSFTAWLPGTYTVTVTDGCGAVSMDQIVLSPASVPLLDLGADTLFCESPFTLTAQSGFTSYLWHNASTATTYTVTGPGNYWVEALAPGGCIVRDDIVVSPCVAVEETLVEGNFVLFPNPNNGNFTLRFGSGALREGLLLKAYDAQGRLVIDQSYSRMGGSRDIPVDLQGQASGIYLLMLEAGDERVTAKIEIHR